MKKLAEFMAGGFLLVCLGCSSGSTGPSKPPVPSLELPMGAGAQLVPFGSQEELVNYMDGLAVKQKASDPNSSGSYAASSEAPSDGAMASEESADAQSDSNQEITNNQEIGVDEGGIVKNYKDFLVVLHRGKLAVAKISKDRMLSLVSKMDVPAKGLDNSAWYDELLLNDNVVIVVGYRWNNFGDYGRGLTEVNFFRIDEKGNINRIVTKFIESADYYSWKNYASRLVGDQLVLYTPRGAWDYNKDKTLELHIPQMYRLSEDGKLVSEGPLYSETDVYKPFQEVSRPVLHSVLHCDVSKPETISCSGKAVLANGCREFYVSQKKAYLWVSDYKNKAGLVYAVPLDGSLGGAFKLPVAPFDQFSFSETKKGLSLFGVSYDAEKICDKENPMILADIPDDIFSSPTPREIQNYYVCLPKADTSQTYTDLSANRFNTTHLVYGAQKKLIAVNRADKKITRLNLPYRLFRLEKAGERMMAFGSDGYGYFSANLGISSLSLSGDPVLSETTLLTDVYLGEWRSHSYSYQSGKEENGSFGIATLQLKQSNDASKSWSYDYEVQSSIHYFDLKQNGNIVLNNAIQEQAFTQSTEQCTTSCIDWYGNTRPIFLNGQILGLLGDQLTLALKKEDGKLEVQCHLNINSGEVMPGK
ncbi:MAG: beta-propeller domain-containing protein [Deltaproteobacteria bacterium]|nr:beta-propeller domain-containing protein [Deltaproteobacteria bacterium]